MPRYRIAGGVLTVVARSSVHVTTARWRSITGEATLEHAELLAQPAATLALAIDLREVDAGDFLTTRKLRKELDLDRHPIARFRLSRLGFSAVDATGRDTSIEGVVAWRGVDLAIAAVGATTIDERGVASSATFDLDVRRFGVTPPRLLVFKVEDVVQVRIDLRADRIE